MNIPVLTSSGKVIVRPDTSWKMNLDASYFPEDVNTVEWSPVIFARISRPGKCIGAKFADRYYDGIGYGVLLYPADYLDGSPEGFAEASCLDHSSYLATPVYNKITLGRPDNEFVLVKDGEEIFRYNSANCKMIEDALAKVSSRVFLRNGDFLAIELQKRQILCERGMEKTSVKGTFCNNEILDFKVIL